MSNNHTLTPYHGVRICNDCGAALHRNGDWYLGGYRSQAEPPCTPYQRSDEWLESAEQIDLEITHG
ncbi:hypothetical protein [Marinobacterium litorale]|uniref:hypothetical protein n=1 Tax=Marinobacterium litorale TaxID=404770 RepID=UPI00041D09E4|nr:hypothetical protein [Marinobacterium litorale]